MGHGIDTIVNAALVLDLLGLEGHKDGGALGGQAAHGLHPLEAIGQHGVEAVLLLVFEGGDLTTTALPDGNQRFGVLIQLLQRVGQMGDGHLPQH